MFVVLISIAALILLITWAKVNPFLAFLLVSILAGFLLGIPINELPKSVEKGIGGMLGSLAIIICLGAMFGKLVAESGAAQKITTALMKFFGEKYIQWALMITGFIVGIPLFYNVGFVLLVPLIFSIVYQSKLPAVYVGLPMLAALSVTHGFLPPHPSPTAIIPLFHANMGLTMIYGIIVAIPAIILAGPVFSRTLKHIKCVPLKTFEPKMLPANELPGTTNSYFSSLMPVILLSVSVSLPYISSINRNLHATFLFLSDPVMVMLASLVFVTYSLGLAQGKTIKDIMTLFADAIKDIALILLIIAGAGALKQVFTDSGVNNEIADILKVCKINLLLLGWIIATVIRVCVGSATVAGLTTASIISPMVLQSNVNPNLMVLAIGAGSLMFSHVNDSGFWMFKEYFNLSIKDTILSWSLMETIVGITGIIGILILNSFI